MRSETLGEEKKSVISKEEKGRERDARACKYDFEQYE